MVAVGDRPEGDHFSQPSGACFKVPCQPAEIVQSLVHSSAQADAMLVLALGERVLETAEEIPGAWKCGGHRAELTQNRMPLARRCTFLAAGDAVQNFPEPFEAMGWQLHRHIDRVDYPT